VLVYVRLDFSISSSKPGKGNAGNAAIVENALRRHAKRAQVYESIDSQFNKLKSNKDVTAFQNALKTLHAEHKTETQAINDIVTKHRSDAPELAEIITDLQRFDRGFWEIYVSYGQAVEKLASNKMTKQQFAENDIQFNKKRDEIAEKINQIIKNM